MSDMPNHRTMQALLEDLRTHQIELEMQNQQLRETQIQLESARQKYFGLFDLAPVPYLLINAAHAVEEINLAGSDLLGQDRRSIVRRPFSTHLADESRPVFHQHIDQVLRAGTAQGAEVRLERLRDRQVVHLVLHSARQEPADGGSARVLTAAFDVTAERYAQRQQRDMELQLRASQKLESLGRMAGGMAHDFNNLLHAIAGFTDLAMGDTELSLIRESLEQIRQTTQRASRLTQQILAFSRRQPAQPTAVQLDDLLLELSPMLQRLMPAKTQVNIRPTPNLPRSG